ncbi:Gfo/Idh/MocA family protein [Rubrobacter aplysinae]|uniref:Gfo/Idh/MocA family protein n=1 Tax=Rubrobacter aplysinae TaxID=909625 RepID=UPI00064C08F1|nr:Gfo/Idh/MocA family oxidoreductase [Rubrobacter aplysinae]
MQEESPLRLGILGAARIALGGIIPAADRSPAVEVTAVASRGGDKRDTIADAAPGARVLEGYEALLQSEDVEAVYIPLPNSLHAEWTMKALSAGKHVLCEKPFALDPEEAAEAVEKARGSGLALMEGFMYRFSPQTERLAEIASGGEIGTVRQAVAEFGHRLDDPSDVRGVGSLGGGALGDVGCYCVSGLRLLFGSEPSGASARARFDGEGSDAADREISGILEFESGFGTISCGLDSARRESLTVTGTEGRATLRAPFRPDKSGGEILLTRGDETTTETFEPGDPYRLELEDFAGAVREGRDPAVGPGEILGNARALGELLASARSGGSPQPIQPAT